MQLTAQHEDINEEEIRNCSKQPTKIKYGHRYRRKNLINTDSEDTVLEFDENENVGKTRLPDLIQDTNSNNKWNLTNTISKESNSCCEMNINVPTKSTPDKCDSSNIDDKNYLFQTKIDLPNDEDVSVLRQSYSANNSPDIRAMAKKKFSLPCDISSDCNINDRVILDVGNLRKKYSNSSTSLPSCTYKSNDCSSIDGSLRRKHHSSTDCGFEGTRCKLDSKVGEFMQEVMSSISEIGHGNPSDGVRKLRGIIKKTLSYEIDEPGSNVQVICKKRREKCKNTVHFSEENITIEIPRPSQPYFRKVKDKFNYYCCFGFLFPNA